MNYKQREAEIDAIPRQRVLKPGTSYNRHARRREGNDQQRAMRALPKPRHPKPVPTGRTILIESSKCIARRDALIAAVAP